MNWQKLELLEARFKGNCDSLNRRDKKLASMLRAHQPVVKYMVAAENEQLHLGVAEAGAVRTLVPTLGAAGAEQVVAKLCPTGFCTDGILVAGIDQGWLWEFLHRMPCSAPARPGYTPPMFFVCRDIEELWVASHVHDWRELFGNARVILRVGADAVCQLGDFLNEHERVTGPKLSVTLDPTLWREGQTLDNLMQGVSAKLQSRMAETNERLGMVFRHGNDAALAARLTNGEKLRVLGITARYTTFLQHSMRDWLAAFESEGHETQLLIEHADHEQLNSLVLAKACADFGPDLVLLIDHYRAEVGGIPLNVPVVMWIQDYLPNLFDSKAGNAQGTHDYCVGYNRTECTRNFSYPAERFLPAMIVVNEKRFAPMEMSDSDRARFGCDVSFVSHASRSAEQIMDEQIAASGDLAKPLLSGAFERLKAIYDSGRAVTHPLHVRGIVEATCLEKQLSLTPDSMQRLVDLFTHRVNNALFRHQTIGWAAETGADLRLYGNGWESHPRFAKYARGVADNGRDLAKIFRASKINLQATPHGAVHQRLLEGLASGGFFLIRQTPGDLIERLYRPLWAWCELEGIESDEQIIQRATPEVYKLLGELQRTLGLDPFKLHMSLLDDLRTSHDIGFTRSASALWGEYDRVAFDSRASLQGLMQHFLTREEERVSLTASMREVVLEKLTYRVVNRRLIKFIATDLAGRSIRSEAA